jgi:putative NADH-flavin reductase
MRLFILGATGRTGVELIDGGLARGHEITAFVRSPEKIARTDTRLRVVGGDPRNAEQIAGALPGHDAVISALGPSVGAALRHTTLLGDSSASVVRAMTRTRVARVLVVSSALLFPGGGAGAGFFRWLIRKHLRDCAAMETTVAQTALDWTIVRPPRLVQTRDQDYRVRVDALPQGVALFGARASWLAVATFLLDAVGTGSHVREVVGMCR